MQFTITAILSLAALAAASPIAPESSITLEAIKRSVVEKRCLYDTCTDCWAATPPIGSSPGSHGAAAGHSIYCATICNCS
ncbi:hypothetical protein D7B24_007644 [Verticillium nonalfalfae]|uniref:Uncharacterized protein n=1 Tax=Verticillium nonalfalfae TaxID=1051616 RepID=A0A3M9Y7F4_9PEZI|nr:uncharacterized protein D7B24_007644 [Verticillium nonalfalfae]RNJ56161.1 hypothetical protein D7B24_007644 [Verticillium nonalfalfae]